MLRALLREMRTNLLGRRATPRHAGGVRRAARLAVECLEARELLSDGVVPGYSLDSSGNLYNTAGAQPQLIDTGVQAIAGTGGSSVFDLHVDGRLYRQDITGTRTYLDGGVMAIAGTGGTSAFDLHSNGALYRQDIAGTWLNIDNGVQAIAGTGGPSAFDLHTNGALYRQDIAGTWLNIDNGVLAIAGTGGPSASDLHTNGALYRQDITGTSLNIDNGVKAIAGTGGSSVFDLHANGALYRQDITGTWLNIDNGVQAIAATGGPSAFDLHTNGALYRQDISGTWAYLDGGVQAIAGAGGVSAFDLHTDGKLYRQDIRGTWAYLGGGVQSFVLVADGSAYWLTADENLYRWTVGGGTSLYASNVGTFLVNADGSITTKPPAWIDSGVLYVLGTSFSDTIIAAQALSVQGNSLTIGALTVQLNGRTVLTADPGQVSKIVVLPGDGNDTVDLSSVITIPAEVYTGDGNNSVTGGQAGNLLVAGNGNNTFVGGKGDDVMIAGQAGNDVFDPVYDRTGGNDTYIVPGLGAANTARYEWRDVRRAEGSVVSVREDNKGCDQLLYNGTFAGGQLNGFTTDHMDDDGFWASVGQVLPSILETAAGLVASALTAGSLSPLAAAALGGVESAVFQGINSAAFGDQFSWLAVGVGALGGGVGTALREAIGMSASDLLAANGSLPQGVSTDQYILDKALNGTLCGVIVSPILAGFTHNKLFYYISPVAGGLAGVVYGGVTAPGGYSQGNYA
jgi:hypothetical protein